MFLIQHPDPDSKSTGFIPDRENRENRENEKCQGNVRELFYFPNVREMSGNFFFKCC